MKELDKVVAEIDRADQILDSRDANTERADHRPIILKASIQTPIYHTEEKEGSFLGSSGDVPSRRKLNLASEKCSSRSLRKHFSPQSVRVPFISQTWGGEKCALSALIRNRPHRLS